jgi:hypothetical protein
VLGLGWRSVLRLVVCVARSDPRPQAALRTPSGSVGWFTQLPYRTKEASVLSDSCHKFLTTVSDAARKLAEEAHWYSDPDSSFRYGQEVDALRRACVEVADDPMKVEAGANLLRLARSVMQFHDTPPGMAETDARQAEMLALVRLLQAELPPDQAKDVPAVVKGLGQDGPAGEQAGSRMKGLLTRLGKPAYDMAIKIISDVGSATVKKLLGL